MTKKIKTITKQLEQKFSETAFRLTQERNDFLLPQIIDFVLEDKWLNLRPEYQRRLVWDTKKRSLFIESLLLNIPIPPLFLYERELNRYEVMDGQQRLNAIVEFYENSFPLKGLEKWKEINGFYYKDLPQTLQRGLDRRRLSATVILIEKLSQEAPKANDIRKLVFERLNTGGMRLNAQELRNCLYDSNFNRLLIKLSRGKLFTKLWDIPPHKKTTDEEDDEFSETEDHSRDRLYRRMLDCEIILRFFAFRERGHIKGSVKSMLDQCMKKNKNLSGSDITDLHREFESRLKLAHSIFGDRAFQYEDGKGNWRHSQPLYDGIMIALDHLWDMRSQLLTKKTKIKRAVALLLKNRKAYEVIVGKPNTARAIVRRHSLLASAIANA